STPTCTSRTLRSLLLLLPPTPPHSLYLSLLSPPLHSLLSPFLLAASHSPSLRSLSPLSPRPLSCIQAALPDIPHPAAHILLRPSKSQASPSPSLFLAPCSTQPTPLLLLPSSLNNCLADCFFSLTLHN